MRPFGREEFDGHRFRGSEVVQPIVAFIRRRDGLDDVIIRSRDSCYAEEFATTFIENDGERHLNVR